MAKNRSCDCYVMLLHQYELLHAEVNRSGYEEGGDEITYDNASKVPIE